MLVSACLMQRYLLPHACHARILHYVYTCCLAPPFAARVRATLACKTRRAAALPLVYAVPRAGVAWFLRCAQCCRRRLPSHACAPASFAPPANTHLPACLPHLRFPTIGDLHSGMGTSGVPASWVGFSSHLSFCTCHATASGFTCTWELTAVHHCGLPACLPAAGPATASPTLKGSLPHPAHHACTSPCTHLGAVPLGL